MHNKYIHSSILGIFIFNEHFNLLEKHLFKNIEQYLNRQSTEEELMKKYSNLKKPEGKELKNILEIFSTKDYFPEFRKNAIMVTRLEIKHSVKDDLLIMQAINCIDETARSTNMLIKRLREWYSIYNPELEHEIENQEKFVELVLTKNKKELLKEIKVDEKESMGADLSKEHIEPIKLLAKKIEDLFHLKASQESYLESIMQKTCPNLLAVAGSTIGARLIEQAGGLKSLMLFPASTIQLLGAEKALFRHMKTKARAPKYGFIHEHPLISRAKKSMHGKIARALALKISVAVKIDYFKGKFIGDKLLKEVEALK